MSLETAVVVSPSLIEKYAAANPLIAKAYRLLEEDEEVNELLRVANIMAVGRLKYNDHGIVHARIVSGVALHLLDLLVKAGREPTTLRDGTAKSLDDVRLIVLFSAYLHDIGNAVHRTFHEYVGALLAKDILNRLLPELGITGRRLIDIRQEVMHSIFATEYNTRCLTMECGIVKISDGLDMAEGRARVPYKMGKLDMHAVSAISIKRVEIEQGERPIKIIVNMNDMAGLFQVEQVLMPKVLTSTIEDDVEIYIRIDGRLRKYYPKE
ncbi:HD domain-containing protein [Pyrofollis japonicus]|uniref:HD domain-containing protein n=1 Tax=Pyrofollis japonicus TaxID=3060460 RepID=UPI00295BBA99|nr:HD domain-containing protein [Pyrofollis japonicus]BEP17487.1 HD domain-containing protein [Pyrofollis japonicus]